MLQNEIVIMANTTIYVDDFSFEENIFFVSQSQRFLVNLVLNEVVNYPSWIESYVYDLYLDSWNNEFKSFYLGLDEDYLDSNRMERVMFIKSLLEDAILKLNKISYREFLILIVKRNKLDNSDSSIDSNAIENQFLPDIFPKDEDDILSRIKGIFIKLRECI